MVILQHPREPDKVLGSAQIARCVLQNSILWIGLSWRNLRSVVGEDVIPSEWLVLYLGTKGGMQSRRSDRDQLLLFGKGKKPEISEVTLEAASAIKGLIVLDGNWSQAKALWWRNPWLLKVRRGALLPARRSLYGELRREPRRECLSTLESIAIALELLGEGSTVRERLMRPFSEFISRVGASVPRR